MGELSASGAFTDLVMVDRASKPLHTPLVIRP
jgi:hypothetical protein